ncbi:MAG TPA: SDR family oxidoreductase [Edaphobacter sp.]|nr:SDR family oxidoreductase [Edaphobacter sp.]
MQKILILGSTGKVGHALTQQLVGAGEQVRAATRNPDGFAPTHGIEPVLFDYTDPSTFEPALQSCNRVFLLEPQPSLPAALHTFMIPFIEVASRSRCKIVMMSSASVAFDSTDPLRLVEEAVIRSGRPFVILRPNWFMDNFHTLWLEPIRQSGVIPLPAGDSRTSFVDSRDVATAGAAALRSNQFNGSTFTLTGPQALTYTEAAAVLSKVCGREIHYIPLEDEPFTQSLLDAGLSLEAAEYITGLFGPTREGAAAGITPDVEKLTGQPPRTFSHYAQDNISAWS